MLLPLIEWVDFLISRHNDQGKTHRSCQKHESLSLHNVVIFFVCNKLKVKSYTFLNTDKSTESKCTISHVKNTILLNPAYLDCNVPGRKKKKKDRRLSTIQTTAKANCSLHRRCLYISTPVTKWYIIFIPITNTI
jgi:hypothetical protein